MRLQVSGMQFCTNFHHCKRCCWCFEYSQCQYVLAFYGNSEVSRAELRNDTYILYIF